MRRFNFFNTNSTSINYFLLLITLTFLAIACNRQMNESAVKKDEVAKNKTKLGFNVFEPDTTLVTENGKEYLKVFNPHPYIDYIKIGKNDYYKIVLRKDIPKESELKREEEVALIKKMVNFNDQLDALTFDEYLNSQVYHKGVRVRGFTFKKKYNYYRVKYGIIDVNVKDVISKEDAIRIGKQKASELSIELADTNDMIKRAERFKTIKKGHPIYVKYDTTVIFEIKKYDDIFLPTYKFKLYNKRFLKNPVFIINANNGEVLKIEDDALHKCFSCYSTTPEETDCSLTHPNNPEPSILACEINPLETHKFDNFPDLFDECSAIESDFYICANQPNNSVWLSDINSKVNAVEGSAFLPQYYSTDNTSYNEKERQILTAFKNTEQVFEYFTEKVANQTKFDEDIPFIFILAANDKTNDAFADYENLSIAFGDGSDEGCLPNVSPQVVAHEFTHLAHRAHYNMLADTSIDGFEILLSLALEEALCDIISLLFNFKISDNYDWSLFNDLCPDGKSFRLLNDPVNSDPPQRILYEDDVDYDLFNERYEWAGIISYWFYLLAEPSYKKLGDIEIGNGIGAEAAEKLIFSILEKNK